MAALRTSRDTSMAKAQKVARVIAGLFVLLLLTPAPARASFLSPEAEDTLATVLARFHHVRGSGGAHRPVLDGAHPAGEDRAQAAPSAVRSHPHAVPAVAGVRRAALADCLDVGVHEAGRLQAGVRNRQASRLLQGARPARAGRVHGRHARSGSPRSRSAACRPVRARSHSRRPGRARGAGWRERRERGWRRWKSSCSASTRSSSG